MGPGWSSGGFPTTVTRVKELLRFVDSPSRGACGVLDRDQADTRLVFRVRNIGSNL